MDDTRLYRDIQIFGATLWTNLSLGSHSFGHARGTAEGAWGMKDYRKIRTGPRSKNRLTAADTLQLHRESRKALETAFAAPHAGPRLIMTHHAPHPASLADPLMDLRWCYASDLERTILDLSPHLWLHGHLHGQANYRIGRTRILMNARGHADEPTATQFQPGLTINL